MYINHTPICCRTITTTLAKTYWSQVNTIMWRTVTLFTKTLQPKLTPPLSRTTTEIQMFRQGLIAVKTAASMPVPSVCRLPGGVPRRLRQPLRWLKTTTLRPANIKWLYYYYCYYWCCLIFYQDFLSNTPENKPSDGLTLMDW